MSDTVAEMRLTSSNLGYSHAVDPSQLRRWADELEAAQKRINHQVNNINEVISMLDDLARRIGPARLPEDIGREIERISQRAVMTSSIEATKEVKP